MENTLGNEMNFEQFLRDKFNVCSEKIPKSLKEAVQEPNLLHEMKMRHGKTLKHRFDSLDCFSKGILLGSADESFSIKPISESQEDQIEECTRQFYENRGYGFYRKDSEGLSDTYFFRNNSGETMIVTYTLPLNNEIEGLLVSTTKV